MHGRGHIRFGASLKLAACIPWTDVSSLLHNPRSDSQAKAGTSLSSRNTTTLVNSSAASPHTGVCHVAVSKAAVIPGQCRVFKLLERAGGASPLLHPRRSSPHSPFIPLSAVRLAGWSSLRSHLQGHHRNGGVGHLGHRQPRQHHRGPVSAAVQTLLELSPLPLQTL